MNTFLILKMRYVFLALIMGIVLLLSTNPAEADIVVISSHTGLQDTDGTHVYLSQGVSAEFCSPIGAVLRAPVAGGGSDQMLYENCDLSPAYVRVDGAEVFILDWGEEDILKLPTTGGTPVKIADSEGAVFERGFDVDADFVYWADSEGVKRAFQTGLGTETLAVTNAFGIGINSLTIDDTHVYYIQDNHGDTPETYEVKRVLKDGGSAETLYLSSGSSCWSASGLQVDENDIYWVDNECDEPNVIRKMLKDGTASPIAFHTAGASSVINNIALKSNLLFFTESEFPRTILETDGKIRYMPKSGGAITDLVTGLTNPFSLIIDNSYVYWSDTNGRVGGTSGTKRENLPPLDLDADGVDQSMDCDDNDPNVTTGNTCVTDSAVTVESDSGDVTVTFSDVTGGGNTTVMVNECTPPIEGITVVPIAPLCADITTDATFEGEAKVCISYDDTGLTLAQEANLQMVRIQDGGTPELLACDPPEPVDTVNNIVCGCTDGFSVFALGTALDSDGDFVVDLLDNCPDTSNLFQEDSDGDGIGDVCEDNMPPTNVVISAYESESWYVKEWVRFVIAIVLTTLIMSIVWGAKTRP